ncbi:ABC transporter permease [Synechococcus sp. BA-132 BA5]|nr:ABC transporter permease [Synechococcus sp. BA-132 BA5]
MNDIAEFLDYGWRLRRVWWFTATARTRARFARTLLGGFWLGLSNLLSIAVLALVYGTVFKVTDFNSYVVYLGVGLVIWNSLAAAITSAPNLLEQNANHLQNTNLNPIFYSLEEWAFQFQTFLQSFLLVLFGLSFFQPTLLLHVLSSSWLPLVNLIVFLFWAPLVICLLGARFRDLYQLVPIVLQLVFLLSPILYRKESLGPLSWTADINPIYRVLSPLRHSLLSGELLWNQILVMALLNVLGIWFGCWLLKRERKYLPFMI